MTFFRLAVPYQIVAAPNSCALCGWDERGHAQWYFGPHLDPGQPKTYVQPDDRLRLTRMKLRRAEREDAAWRASPSTCLACPDGCSSCTRDGSDCECYEHQDNHPDAVRTTTGSNPGPVDHG